MVSDYRCAQFYETRLLRVAVIGEQIKVNPVLSTLRFWDLDEQQAWGSFAW